MDRIPIPLLDTFLVLAAHGEQDPACLYASTLGTFRRSSRTMYSALSDGANPVLYAHIFEQRYPDASRIRRLLQHLPPIITTPHSVPLAAELRRRLRTERVFRATHASGSLQDARLPAALCDAYVAVLLDPRALTALRDAHAYDVCKAWLQQRLYDGAEGTAGWAPQTESNAFALALFYMLTTRSKSTTRVLRARIFTSLDRRTDHRERGRAREHHGPARAHRVRRIQSENALSPVALSDATLALVSMVQHSGTQLPAGWRACVSSPAVVDFESGPRGAPYAHPARAVAAHRAAPEDRPPGVARRELSRPDPRPAHGALRHRRLRPAPRYDATGPPA